MFGRVGPFAIALAIGLASPAAAQQEQDKAAVRNEAARLLEARKEKLSEAERRARALQSEVQATRQEQASINEKLIETGRLVQQTEGRMSQIEARLADYEGQEKSIRESLSRRHGEISKLFAAMQRMGRNPPPVIITRREDALAMVRSAMLLARAFPQLRTQAEALSSQLDDLVRVTTGIRTEGERLRGESAKLADARRELGVRLEMKRQSVAERQHELDDIKRAAADISKSVTDLGDLIGRLDKTVAERTTLGAYERDQKQAALAPESPPAGAAAPPQPPVAEHANPQPLRPSVPDTAPEPQKDAHPKVALAGPRPTIALEPSGLRTANPARMTPAVPFPSTKGHLPLPVQGRKLNSFGDRNQLGNTWKGIAIETRPSAVVTSPCDGWIVYAGEFRSYGQILIINAGNGYHIMLANLSRVDVEVGRFVLASEPVGTMSANFKGKAQDSSPVLFVEFRNAKGESIDPDPWWAEGSQKVQG